MVDGSEPFYLSISDDRSVRGLDLRLGGCRQKCGLVYRASVRWRRPAGEFPRLDTRHLWHNPRQRIAIGRPDATEEPSSFPDSYPSSTCFHLGAVLTANAPRAHAAIFLLVIPLFGFCFLTAHAARQLGNLGLLGGKVLGRTSGRMVLPLDSLKLMKMDLVRVSVPTGTSN